MKEIKITIKGTLLSVEYASLKTISEIENDDYKEFGYCRDSIYGWQKVEGIYINVEDGDLNNADNVINKIGKYFKVRDYFHNLFGDNSDHPLPVEVHSEPFNNQKFYYKVELEDDEEFDIKKVQLIKSEYEVAVFPHFILTEKILYNNKEVPTITDNDYFVYEEDEHDTNIIENFLYW